MNHLNQGEYARQIEKEDQMIKASRNHHITNFIAALFILGLTLFNAHLVAQAIDLKLDNAGILTKTQAHLSVEPLHSVQPGNLQGGEPVANYLQRADSVQVQAATGGVSSY